MPSSSLPPALPSERRPLKPLWGLLLAMLVLASIVFYLVKVTQAIRGPRVNLHEQNLMDIYQGCLRYADHHQGRFPPNLETLKQQGFLESHNQFELSRQLSNYHYFGYDLTAEAAKKSTGVLLVELKSSIRLKGSSRVKSQAENMPVLHRVLLNNGTISWVGVNSDTFKGDPLIMGLDPHYGLFKGENASPTTPLPRPEDQGVRRP